MDITLCQNKKGKGHPKHAMKAHRGVKRYSYILTQSRRLKEVGGAPHTPATLPPGKLSRTRFTGGWVSLGAGLSGQEKSRHHLGSKTVCQNKTCNKVWKRARRFGGWLKDSVCEKLFSCCRPG